jgi:asparagine synthase (glutamine-hydrolysing)
LRPMMRDLLSAETIQRRGFFSAPCIEGWIKEHLDGRENHSHRLWALMVFELWLRNNELPAALPEAAIHAAMAGA